MSAAPVTRIAPTPSGYLHLGNAWSFAITWLAARSRGGRIHLRIDDLDTERLRGEYLEDIFASLAWLGLDWDHGPRDAADFKANHSQRLRLPAYRAALDRLLAQAGPEGPLVFACACSRQQARRASEAAGLGGIYPGTCRDLGLDRKNPEFVLRLRTGSSVGGGDAHPLRDLAAGMLALDPGRDMGDFVLRQRNGDPAYQLASVVDDEAMGVNLVVRGLDLLPSTGAQAALARHLGFAGFAGAEFLHHGLIEAQGAGKLSKSAGASAEGAAHGAMSVASLRARLGSPAALYRWFAARLGQDPAGKARAEELLPGFSPARVPLTPLHWEDFLRETA